VRYGAKPGGNISHGGALHEHPYHTEHSMSLTTNVKKAARKVEKAVTGAEPEADLLDTLKEEHELVSELLKKLVDSDKAAERRSLVAQIKANLVPHVKAEQKILYDAIIALKDKDAKQDGEEGYIEHALASKTLADLEKISDATGPEHRATAKVLRELIEHHVKEEESQVWGDAKKHFSAEQRQAMNRRYLLEKKKVRLN
jgi:Hemerythrin HHE cation binding domain